MHLMHHQFKLITPKWSCKRETRKSVSAGGHASMHRAVGTLQHLKVLQRGIGNDDSLNPAYQNTSSGLLIAYIPLLLSCRQRQVWQYFYAFDFQESFFNSSMVTKFYFRGTSYVGSKVWAPTINGMVNPDMTLLFVQVNNQCVACTYKAPQLNSTWLYKKNSIHKTKRMTTTG